MPNHLRIGAFSSLTGVSPHTLRAWERRYRLISPERTLGRFRLYSDEDVERVREMARLTHAGVAASEAARRVLADEAPALPGASRESALAAAARDLHAAFRSFDEGAIERALDRVLALADLDTAIRDVFLPALIDIGSDWAEGSVTVAQEHFSVGVLRARLMALARGWDSGLGPRVLLACPPGEDHDVSLVMFGLSIHRRGWRVTFLGANTPLPDLVDTQRRLEPRLTVLFSLRWNESQSLVPALSEAAVHSQLILAGPGAQQLAGRVGCSWLDQDPLSAADGLTRAVAPLGSKAPPSPRRARGPSDNELGDSPLFRHQDRTGGPPGPA